MSEFEKELEKNMKLGKVAHERESLYSDFLVSKRDIERIFEEWQPPKPLVEVPKFVADFIKAMIAKDLKPLINSSKFGELGFTEEKLQEILYWIKEHQEEYMRVWLDGYTVEKEQLYYIKLPKTGAYYLNLRIDTGDFVYGDNEENPNYKTKFTEQEIKDIDERYWSFRVEVDE